MQERHHVKTNPGEPHAVPEYAPHAVHVEQGAHTQSEDINIPAVATFVAFFAVTLVVVIVSIQAWFYNTQRAEIEAKTPRQDDKSTWVGAILDKQYQEVTRAGFVDSDRFPAPPQGATAPHKPRIAIDQAMQLVAKDYSGGARR